MRPYRSGSTSLGRPRRSKASRVLPISLTLPTISGGKVAGSSTLTWTPGTYFGNPVPTVTPRWLRGGVPIDGEIAGTYITAAGDAGRSITVQDIVTNDLGTVFFSSLPHIMEPAASGPGPTPVPDWANATIYNANVAGTSFVIDKPINCAVGDELYLFQLSTATNPSVGWDQVTGFTRFVNSFSNTSDLRLSVQKRPIDGTEGTTFTSTQTATGESQRQIGVCVRVPGTKASGSTEAVATPKLFSALSSHTVDQITTLGANRRVISVFGFFGTDGQPVGTTGTGWTERKEVLGGNTAGNAGYPLLVISDKEQASAGPTGNVSHTTAVADRGASLQFAIVPADTGGVPVDFPPKIGTITPGNNDASAGTDGDARTGFRANGTDANFGSTTGGPFAFSEVWARKTGTPFVVDDMRLGSQLPLAKISNADAAKLGFYDPATGQSLGPITLPWEAVLNRYGANIPGAAAFLQGKEGVPLDLFYQLVLPTINAPRFQGFGANTTGGQGGRVIFVTSGANSGPGTLREALQQTGPRVIVFTVNLIQLTSQIIVAATQGDFSMYGQTAGGVQVIPAASNNFATDGEALIKYRCSNYIVQGVKFRVGNRAALDAVSIGSGTSTTISENVVFDHCSFEWGVDENVDIGGNLKKATLSNCIISQGLRNSIHPKGVAHSMGALFIAYGGGAIFPDQVSCHRNLLSHNVGRNPWMKHGKRIEWENNFVHGPGCDNSRYGQFGNNVALQSGQFAINCSANIRGNFYQKASDSGSTTNGLTFNNSGFAATFATDDNVFKRADASDEPTSYLVSAGITHLTGSLAFTSSGYTPMLSSAVKAHVLANAGAFPPNHDSVDASLISKANLGQPGIIDSQSEMGGYPTISFTPRTDSDSDGIPDFYEGTYASVEDYCDALLTGAATPGA